MTEIQHKSKWWNTMIAKYGSEEAVREVMRQNVSKSKRNPTGKGGWSDMKQTDPELHKQLSSRGGKHSHESNDPKPNEQPVHEPNPTNVPRSDSDQT